MASRRRCTPVRRPAAALCRLHGRIDCTRARLCLEPSSSCFSDVERMRSLAALFILVILGGRMAFAHEADAEQTYLAWTFDPWIVLPLTAAGAVYLGGAIRLWRRRGYRGVALRHAAAYAAGWASLALALISPLHWLGERVFTFHMIEHEIIMAVAAPLIVLAKPIGTILWGLPTNARRLAAAFVRNPWIRAFWKRISEGRNATILHGVAIWGW